MFFEKSRFEIWNQLQHPYKHTLGDFAYSHVAVPWVASLEGALNALFAVNYPNTKESVEETADLPLVGNSPLDYRVVVDDGDGKGAGYRWEKREGELDYSWHKIYDMDWGENSILSNFLTKTNDTYVSKFGQMDVDINGDLLTGDQAGQYIYGGSDANSHLTLFSNSGDGVGAQTGFIQFGDQVRPLVDNLVNLGTATKKFKDAYLSGVLTLPEITISNSEITSSTGAISFGNENLNTTGAITGLSIALEKFLTMKEDDTQTNPLAGYKKLYFKTDGILYKRNSAGVESIVGTELTVSNDNRLIRSNGTNALQDSGITVSDLDAITGLSSLGIGAATFNPTSIVSTTANTDFSITANGTGAVSLSKLKMSSFALNSVITPDAVGLFRESVVKITPTGAITGADSLAVGSLTLSGTTIASTGNVLLNPTGTVRVTKDITPAAAGLNIGDGAEPFGTIVLSGNISSTTQGMAIDDLVTLRDINVGVAAGHSLFYNGSKWVSSAPDAEIDHGTLGGLPDDDHTQYALLAGRATGQTLKGGTDASENLTLDSTAHATKGKIVLNSEIEPSADNTQSMGTSSKRFSNLYMGGQGIGFRFQNVTDGTLPASNAANKGRAVYNETTKQVMVDTGLGWVVEGVNKYLTDVAFDGVETTKNITVSSVVSDARNCIVQLLNSNNSFDRIYCNLKAIDAATIRVETNVPLPVGSYRLIVME